MNATQFLQIGGAILIIVGIVGFLGIIGPTPEDSIFGENWFFNNVENFAHLVLGIVAIIASYSIGNLAQKWLAAIVGIAGILVGIYGLFSFELFGAHLENPMDTILHITIGAWALWAAMKTKEMPEMKSVPMGV